ncbi:uncharacterized protein N7503_007838 [Penicillium pulvis]|uniref:uncharacterized protein n=1 Tax=Penicillium pulvis TaxID=1562058 RepID=UPI0025492200|nr:uncharacterized protein N7503_007838 [Penicillium pulvis]KAJ5798542.1 hypothetical protein N7503_007838 [Penicillium pulvis]
MPSTAAALRAQWKEPSDVFTVLLIVGGEVVRCALGAMSGGILTPVTFSYGWAAFAISAILSAAGENRLMPDSPLPTLLVINLTSGYRRLNRSWTLGRLFQTYEYWMAPEVRTCIQDLAIKIPDEERAALAPRDGVAGTGRSARGVKAPLCVAVYDWDVGPTGTTRPPNKAGRPGHDWVWSLGLGVSLIQLGISIIPFAMDDDWRILLVTAGGTVLAYLYGALPQWRREKWGCRKNSAHKDVAITLGNGTQHVVIIRGHVDGFDLEDLAGGQTHADGDDGENRRARVLESEQATRALTVIFALCWLALLVCSTGIQTHTWYLLAIGGLGMLHNLVVAGAPRRPDMLGVPIKLAAPYTHAGQTAALSEPLPSVFAEAKVMWTLMELEIAYEGFGKALLKEFFPGEFRDWETAWWNYKVPNVELRRTLLAQKKYEEYVKRKEKQLKVGSAQQG